jgi:hypothetical protein
VRVLSHSRRAPLLHDLDTLLSRLPAPPSPPASALPSPPWLLPPAEPTPIHALPATPDAPRPCSTPPQPAASDAADAFWAAVAAPPAALPLLLRDSLTQLSGLPPLPSPPPAPSRHSRSCNATASASTSAAHASAPAPLEGPEVTAGWLVAAAHPGIAAAPLAGPAAPRGRPPAPVLPTLGTSSTGGSAQLTPPAPAPLSPLLLGCELRVPLDVWCDTLASVAAFLHRQCLPLTLAAVLEAADAAAQLAVNSRRREAPAGPAAAAAAEPGSGDGRAACSAPGGGGGRERAAGQRGAVAAVRALLREGPEGLQRLSSSALRAVVAELAERAAGIHAAPAAARQPPPAPPPASPEPLAGPWLGTAAGTVGPVVGPGPSRVCPRRPGPAAAAAAPAGPSSGASSDPSGDDTEHGAGTSSGGFARSSGTQVSGLGGCM